MPFPLILPFLAKGAVVAAKILASKGAAATAAKATTVAVKSVGLKTTVAAIGTGLVIAGGLHWTYERFIRAGVIIRAYQSGDHAGAATDFAKLIASFGVIGDNGLIDDAQTWIDHGMDPTSGDFAILMQDLKRIIDGMIETGQTPSPSSL